MFSLITATYNFNFDVFLKVSLIILLKNIINFFINKKHILNISKCKHLFIFFIIVINYEKGLNLKVTKVL